MNHGVNQQSEAYLTLINALSPIKFWDSSYSNDVCDSIMNDEYGIQIFLPNVANPFACDDSEEISTFSFSFSSDEGNNIYIHREFNIGELLWLLQRLKMRLDIGGHTEVMLVEYMLNDVKDESIDFKRFVEPYLSMTEIGDQHSFEYGKGNQITVTYIS